MGTIFMAWLLARWLMVLVYMTGPENQGFFTHRVKWSLGTLGLGVCQGLDSPRVHIPPWGSVVLLGLLCFHATNLLVGRDGVCKPLDQVHNYTLHPPAHKSSIYFTPGVPNPVGP